MPVPYRIDCPYCGEIIELLLDESVDDQCYIEDCAVCCRPMEVFVRCRPGQVLGISVTAE